jgi:hypothetical protein
LLRVKRRKYMADINLPTAPIGPIDYGTLLTSYGRNQADIANTQANTALLQQQAQGAALQNQKTQQLLSGPPPLLASLQSSPAPQDSDSDSSGILPGGDIDRGGIASLVRNQYAPIPTAPPPAVLAQAQYYAVRGAPEMARMVLDNYANQAAAASTQRAQGASVLYDKASDVYNAPKGAALTKLQLDSPQTAAMLEQRAQDNDWTPQQLDQHARDWAAATGIEIHQYSNRPAHFENGTMIDDKTGEQVIGQQQVLTGLNATDKQKAYDSAMAQIDVPMSDGTTQKMARWQAPVSAGGLGGMSPTQYVVDQDRAARTSAATPPAGPVPVGSPGASPAAARPPASAAPTGAPPGAAAPGGGAPQVPGAPPTQDNGLLPGVNPLALPRPQLSPIVAGQTQSPANAITANGIATERLAQLKDSNNSYIEDQKEGALIQAAQRESAALANNPRMVGPGSEFAQTVAKIKSAVTGQPPDALVDLGSLDKMLLQMGAQNVRQALSGQRITNSEFLMMLSKGNPNTEQPLGTINRLLGYLGAQNDYDQRFQRTKQAALNTGANPLTVDSDIGARVNRGNYVEARTGVRPPLPSGTQASSGPAVQTATGPNGQRLYLRNGQWAAQ